MSNDAINAAIRRAAGIPPQAAPGVGSALLPHGADATPARQSVPGCAGAGTGTKPWRRRKSMNDWIRERAGGWVEYDL
jgi:hypothetical protein